MTTAATQAHAKTPAPKQSAPKAETPAAPKAHAPKTRAGAHENVKLFSKWDTDVKIEDISLANYIDLTPQHIPHTFGRHNKKRFGKTEINIVERLVNKIMRSGQGKKKLSGKYIRGRNGCGKKIQTIQIVERAFDIVAKQTGENPLQVLIRAIQNSAPREDTTRLNKGGMSYTQAVDVAPQKRIDESIKNLALATFAQSFNNNTAAEEALAREIMLAAKDDSQSFAVKRKDEVERIAKSSR